MDPQPTPADRPSVLETQVPMTPAEAWAVSVGAGLLLLFALACASVAFDLPTLRHALDVRTFFH